MIKISVIIPAYNVEKYITKTLNSIINQTFKDFEIIVVNDGSKDKTEETARNILSKSGVKFRIINQQNQGVSKARNTGIEEAQGEYIYFIDGDDYAEEDLLYSLYSKIEGSGCDTVFCGYDHVDESGYSSDRGKYKNYLDVPISGKDAVRMMLTDKIWLWMNSVIFKKSLIIDNDIRFDSQFKYNEDVLFTYRCLYNSYKVGSYNKELVHYLKRSGSAMNTVTNDYFQLVYAAVNFINFIDKEDEETISCVLNCRAATEVLRVFSYLSRKGYDRREIIKFINEDEINKYLSNYRLTELSLGKVKQYLKIKSIMICPTLMYRVYKAMK